VEKRGHLIFVVALYLGLWCVSRSFAPYPQHISTIPLSEGIALYQQLVH